MTDDTLRVAFAVQTDDGKALQSCRNLIAAVHQPVRIELVCFGAGITVALAADRWATPVTDLLNTETGPGGDVEIAVSACRNSLMSRGIDDTEAHSALIGGVTVVPAGVLRLVELQCAGAAYLAV